jgi:hypothetical protein
MADASALELTKGAEPAAPAANDYLIYVDQADGALKKKNNAGDVINLEAAVTHIAGDYTAAQIDNVPAGNIISTNVQAAINELDAEKAPSTHVGANGVSEHALATGAAAGFMSPSDFTKLAGVATGATANDTDANLKARANHTGTQLASTISDFNSAADTRVTLGILAHEAASDPHSVYATDADLATGLGTKSNVGHTHVSTDITNFDEAAQDAIGGALADTASIDLSYNDSLNQISADVKPAGVDHNALANFSANKHVDHTTVQIATAATSGLSGGGDISATRNLSLNIDGLTAQTERIASGDELAVYDISQTAHRKLTLQQLLGQRRSLIDVIYAEAEDFIRDSLGALTAAGAGTGNSTQVGTYGQDTTENAIGISESDTGTTTTGRRTVSSALGSLMSTLAKFRFGARIALEALSNGTDTYTSYIGFFDNSAAGDQNNGAYFRYTHSVNGGKWEAVTAKAGVRTATDTGVAANILYDIFEIEIAQDGASVLFYINGTLVATNTTNIPIATAAQTFGYGWKIEKSAGTTASAISADYYYYEHSRTGAR